MDDSPLGHARPEEVNETRHFGGEAPGHKRETLKTTVGEPVLISEVT